MSSDRPDMDVMASFVDEAGQCLETLNSKLLVAESGQYPAELIDEMFRAAHSMKGSAGFLKLTDIQAVTHSLETVLDNVRKNVLDFTDEVVDALFCSFDTVAELLERLTQNDDSEYDINSTVQLLDSVLGLKPQAQSIVEAPEKELGAVPRWLRGKLSLDDVMEAMIARTNGEVLFTLRFSLSDVFTLRLDPYEVASCISENFHIRRSCALVEPDSPWYPLANFRCSIGLLCWGKGDVKQTLEQMSLPNCMLCLIEEGEGEAEETLVVHKEKLQTSVQTCQLNVKPDMVQHLPAWISATSEELDGLDAALLGLEQSPDDFLEDIDQMFRLMHRLKGSAGTMGLEEMARIAHNCESVLDCFRRNKSRPSADAIQALFMAKDIFNECLKQIKNGKITCPDASMLDQCLCSLIDTPEVVKPQESYQWQLDSSDMQKAEAALSEGNTVYKLLIELEQSVAMADLRYAMILKHLGDVGDILVSRPTEDELKAGIDSPPPLEVLFDSAMPQTQIFEQLQVDQVECCRVERLECKVCKDGQSKTVSTKTSIASSGAVGDTVRVDAARLDNMMNVAGELVITKARVLQLSESLFRAFMGIDINGLEALISNSHVSGAGKAGNGHKLTAERLRHLDTLVEKLQQAQNNVVDLRETTLELHRHTSVLQNSVMEARMVPVGPLFQRFHRLVRDVGKERSKKATLVLAGETTELDKKLIDELTDPLTHLIRNSVDHGLEAPQDRANLGKPENGTISLEAYHEGGQICIRVADDGRGLDLQKIKEKGIKNKLITTDYARTMADDEAYSLIFQPGFSTAAQVTNISGRGVGMDIVKSKIAELNGKIEISSEAGKGSSMTIRLPLTLAMIESLLVRIGSINYAFPLEAVREIVEVGDEDIHTIEECGRMIRLRDKVLPLIDLESTIGTCALSNTGGKRRAVVTKGVGGVLAIEVDSVIGEEEVVVKALTEEFAHVKGVSGATVLGDGSIALILDVSEINDMAKRSVLADGVAV